MSHCIAVRGIAKKAKKVDDRRQGGGGFWSALVRSGPMIFYGWEWDTRLSLRESVLSVGCLVSVKKKKETDSLRGRSRVRCAACAHCSSFIKFSTLGFYLVYDRWLILAKELGSMVVCFELHRNGVSQIPRSFPCKICQRCHFLAKETFNIKWSLEPFLMFNQTGTKCYSTWMKGPLVFNKEKKEPNHSLPFSSSRPNKLRGKEGLPFLGILLPNLQLQLNGMNLEGAHIINLGINLWGRVKLRDCFF